MIRRWLLALLETEIRAVVRDEVDLYLLELGLDDRLDTAPEQADLIGYMPTDLR